MAPKFKNELFVIFILTTVWNETMVKVGPSTFREMFICDFGRLHVVLIFTCPWTAKKMWNSAWLSSATLGQKYTFYPKIRSFKITFFLQKFTFFLNNSHLFKYQIQVNLWTKSVILPQCEYCYKQGDKNKLCSLQFLMMMHFITGVKFFFATLYLSIFNV